MEFVDKIDTSLSRVDFSAAGKDEALHRIAEIAAESPLLAQVPAGRIYEQLREREEAVSTGVGDGIAIPHARLQELSDFVVLVLVAPKGVDFEALDKRRVRIFVVILAPADQVSEQLEMLAGVSRLLSKTAIRKELLGATTPEILNEIFARNAEGRRDTSSRSDHMKLLVLVLYYEEDMHEILEFLLDRGVKGATILSSQGMGAFVSNIPLFASFLGFMREDRNASNTILALIPAGDEHLFVSGVESIVGDLDKRQGAMVMVLDVPFFKGTMAMI
jgi:mannitol/fructose-specific phosphotransferase system IIA component (Ntr-type)